MENSQFVEIKQKANKVRTAFFFVKECFGEDMYKNVEVLAQHLPVLKKEEVVPFCISPEVQ